MNIDRRAHVDRIFILFEYTRNWPKFRNVACVSARVTSPVSIYARQGEYLVVRTLNDTVLCVRGCRKFRANSRERERERGDERKRQENESAASIEIREGKASHEKTTTKRGKKMLRERETYLAVGAQLDWPFVKDANRPWGHSAGSCSDTTGKQRRKILFSKFLRIFFSLLHRIAAKLDIFFFFFSFLNFLNLL